MNLKMKSSNKSKAIHLATKLIISIQNEDKLSAAVLLTRIEALGFGVIEDVDFSVQDKSVKSTNKRLSYLDSTLENKIVKCFKDGFLKDNDCGVHNETN